MKRRMFALLLCAAMVMTALSGCGGGSGSGSSGSSGSSGGGQEGGQPLGHRFRQRPRDF